MTAALARVDAAAGNIANQQTPGYRRQQVDQTADPDGGVEVTLSLGVSSGGGGDDDLATDLVQQKAASYDFKANLRVLQAGDDMLGSLIDTLA